jgi:hypothetical protein
VDLTLRDLDFIAILQVMYDKQGISRNHSVHAGCIVYSHPENAWRYYDINATNET